MNKVIYFQSPTLSLKQTPRYWIDSLNPKQKAKIFRIFSNLEEYGLSSIQPHIRKITHTPLWEIRILGQDNIRIIYATVIDNDIIILHAFFKKSQKTPSKEIEIALNRYHQIIDK